MDMMGIANLLFAVLRVGCLLGGFYVARGILFDSGLYLDEIFEDPDSRASQMAKAFLWVCLGYLFASALFEIVGRTQDIAWVVWYQVIRVAEPSTSALQMWLTMAPASLSFTVAVLLVTYGLAALAFVRLDWDSIEDYTGWIATPVEKAFVLLTMGHLLFAPAQLLASAWDRTLMFVPPESALAIALQVGQNLIWPVFVVMVVLFLILYRPRGAPPEDEEFHDDEVYEEDEDQWDNESPEAGEEDRW